MGEFWIIPFCSALLHDAPNARKIKFRPLSSICEEIDENEIACFLVESDLPNKSIHWAKLVNYELFCFLNSLQLNVDSH